MSKKFLVPLVVLTLTVMVGATGCEKKTTEEKANAVQSQLEKALDLSDVQRRQVDTLKNQILNKRAELQRNMADQIQFELRSQLRKEKFDPAQFEDFKEKHLERTEEMTNFIGEKFAEFHALLSPPQREKLAEEIDKNKQKWFGGMQ